MKFLALFSLLAPTAIAQTVVLPGDNLLSIVAAAPSGTIIEIRSNETFVGELSWEEKSLTLVAGDGFTPAIRGNAGGPALSFRPTLPPAVIRCEGLRLLSGPVGPFFQHNPEAVFMGGTGTDPSSSIVLKDCIVGGSIRLSGTGSAKTNLELIGTEVLGPLFSGGTGDLSCQISISEGSSVELLSLSGTGDMTGKVTLSDSQVSGPLVVRPVSAASYDIEVRRCTVLGQVLLQGSSSATIEALMESCYLQGKNLGTGLEVAGDVALRGVNLTLTGYEVGLQTGPTASLENLLLLGNRKDVSISVPSGTVAHSLIADGTFAGVNGNFTGVPQIGPDAALESGSLGLDAGNSAAADLGSLDLTGSPRIQDSDSDGVQAVNVGAHETTSQCRPASHTYFTGFGGNEIRYIVLAEATLGGTFIGVVVDESPHPLTVLAVGTRVSSGFEMPGIDGKVLLKASSLKKFSLAAGTHSIQVPAIPALCGRVVHTQALQLDPVSAAPQALNGVSLTIGL